MAMITTTRMRATCIFMNGCIIAVLSLGRNANPMGTQKTEHEMCVGMHEAVSQEVQQISGHWHPLQVAEDWQLPASTCCKKAAMCHHAAS